MLGLLVLAGLLGLDRVVYERVSLRLNTNHPLDRDFYTVTRPLWFLLRTAFAHAAGGAMIYALVLALHREHWRAANRLLLSVLVAVAAAFVLQGAIGRLRPNQAGSHLAFAPPFAALFHSGDRGACFPSGEATMAFALAYSLSRLYPRLTAVFFSLAALAAAARLVNGAHYLSDVAAGALLGVFSARAVYSYLSTSGPLRSGARENR